MLKSWGLSLAGVVGIALSLAYGQLAPALKTDGRREEGKRYLAEGRAGEAKEIFEDLLKSHPRDPDLHLFLALALLRLRDSQAAESRIRSALGLAPDHAEARTLLGWIYLELRRDYASAVEEYTRVARLRPDSPEAYNNLGVALKKKGDLEKATEAFGQALELSPNYAAAWSNRGWVHAQQRRWREARRDFEQALKIDLHDEGALYGLAQALKEERDYAGAEKALRSLMIQSPNFVYWLDWGELQLVRYYWLLLLAAGAVYLRTHYKRRKSNGRGDGKET